ncbi:MAG: hypothetical protein NC131_11120 [Roseburia sp.]|nr:hypothetical protein [Roseburia sp.]
MGHTEFSEKFIDKNIAELALNYDRIKGANTNIARITPDFIDGLKPVQRRAVYIMYLKDQGKTYRKLATISGDTFGRIHPHAPTAIEDAVVGMEQDWMNSIPLIDGEGNFGTVAGDVAGASRYIKARLSEYARACFFDDWKDSVIDMTMGYDEETMEPLYLPAKYPNVLLNGCLGIGYGLASNLPAFNFKEVVEATITLMLDPSAPIVLIPDSPTGASIIEADFARISDRGNGAYTMRCTYEIDAEENMIRITSLPYQISANTIRERIAEIKEKNGLPELMQMNDLSGNKIDIQLYIRDDVNPYKFMKKLIGEVAGLEKTYPINITVVNDYKNYDYSIKDLLKQWINWRREQKRTVISHKRTTLLAEQRTNDVKIFVLSGDNLEKTQTISRTSRNREEIEHRLIEAYRNSEIRMDSMQARVIANMRNVDLCVDAREEYLKRREEIKKELQELEDLLNTENGIDKVIIAELRDGIKRFGKPRRSNVVPAKIKVSSDVEGACVIQLSSDGTVNRRMATNVYEEPVPLDNNGFAVRVENDASFVLVDNNGYHSYVRVRDIPFDSDVPVNRYSRQRLNGNIVAMLPCDIDAEIYCVLISRKGIAKRFRISDMGPSRKPCISIDKDDSLVRGIVLNPKLQKDILVYTRNGMGQRLDPTSIRATSPQAKGTSGFKLNGDDEIVGCYTINPAENQYILYVTSKGKMRLNNIEYLPLRDSKHDAMVRLITLNERDRLVSIVGCNKLDKVQVFYDDATSEIIEISKLEETTMGADPKKITTKQNAVTTNIVKVKLL